MNGNSEPVQSRQRLCHPALGRTVARHLASQNLRPPAPHTLQAFEAIRSKVEGQRSPLVFDSFCGTGLSTGLLAQRHPDCLVIGIDKSAHRLDRHQPSGVSNYLLVRADCDDFWRLAADAGWRLQHHYLLYPNPWPKPGQLKRRVHGSPAFVDLLKLGGALELRSNWQVYVEEFGCALIQAGYFPRVDRLVPDVSLSLFEQKYRQSGHLLWRCRCEPGEAKCPAATVQA